MTDRKKPGVAFWATVGLVVLFLGYPLSFGPACWWFSTAEMPVAEEKEEYPSLGVMILTSTEFRYAPTFYWPMGWLEANGPKPVGRCIRWYATIGNERICLPVDSSCRKWAGD